jgi:hypothetical protein
MQKAGAKFIKEIHTYGLFNDTVLRYTTENINVTQIGQEYDTCGPICVGHGSCNKNIYGRNSFMLFSKGRLPFRLFSGTFRFA